jgi:hypothetical protein
MMFLFSLLLLLIAALGISIYCRRPSNFIPRSALDSAHRNGQFAAPRESNDTPLMRAAFKRNRT